MPLKTKDQMAEYSRRYSFWKYQYTVRNVQFQEEFNTLRKRVEQATDWQNNEYPSWVDFVLIEMCFDEDGEPEEYERLLNEYGFNNIEPPMSAEIILKNLAAHQALEPHKLCSYKSPIRPSRRRALSWDGETSYATLEINLDSPTKSILAQVEDEVEKYRHLAELIKGMRSGEKSIHDFHLPKSEHAAEIDYANMTEHSILRRADASRAFGLWVWDYINGSNKKIAVAISELENCFNEEIEDLAPEKTPSGFRDCYYGTVKCISACEVLNLK